MAAEGAPLDIGPLVVEHHQALYRYAFRLTGSAADAEDLTQQVFLIAQQKLEQLRDARCARSWLFTVLRNDYLKARRQRLPLPAASLELDINGVPDETIESEIDSEQLQAAIDSLDDDFKVTLLLFYFEQQSYREIADTLGIPLGTVMSRLARAKSRLRACLCQAEQLQVTPPSTGPVRRPAFATSGQSTTNKT
ncbi:MAG: RNA polymerase sigma factor [Pirellulales bacterium]